jgi:Fur family iron response transcriptional regulator
MYQLYSQGIMEKQSIIDMLEDHDIQPTQQRIEIAQILFAQDQHLSAEQVLNAVNQLGATVSKATVYNTLGLFADKGLVRQVIVDPSRVFYDSNTSEHHHLYNSDTGMLMDIDARQISIQHLPELPEGVVAEGVDVIIRVRSQASA